MSYLNRFIIEEEAQFECIGVFSRNIHSSGYPGVARQLKNQLRSIENFIGHIIVADDIYVANQMLKSIEPTPQNLLLISEFIITCVQSERIECVQKDNYERIHREGYSNDSNPSNLIQIFIPERSKPVGDDIEDFFERSKLGEISIQREKRVKAFISNESGLNQTSIKVDLVARLSEMSWAKTSFQF